MPVSYSNLDKKKGAEKSKLSLSIHRKNVDLLINDNTHNLSVTQQNYGNRKQLSENNNQLTESKSEEKSDGKLGSSDLVLTFYKENKPVKRTRNGTYSKTLNAAKKLKSIDNKIQESIPIRKLSREPFDNFNLKLSSAAMLNGHHQSDVGPYGGTLGNNSTQRQQKTPIATLSNLGNTCFLNSVLYTLRFAPRFLHNLHHLVADLAAVDQKLGTVRLKSSSLGRSAAGLAASGTRSWSSKDLLSLGQPDLMPTKSKIQIATERLHETYSSLRAAESRCLVNNSLETTPEPYAADPFLTALRDVNSTFEGNRQQDAHELLVCVLDSIRETCRALRHRAARLQHQENNESVNALNQQPSIENDNASNLICSKSSLGNLRKSWKKRKEAKASKSDSPTKDRARSTPSILEEDGGEGTPEAEPRARPGWDFIAEDFEGTTVLRTTCLECEMVTERKQAMCDICIPVAEEADTTADDTDEPFLAACVTSECLRDQNKYWCERCLRYNEARRSVAYETLPRILVLQLKRFSGGMEKITRHAPTPRVLACFCESCAQKPANARPHRYTLWAVIVHLGQSLSGGHYVAYTRAHTEPGRRCEREERAMAGDRAPERPGFMRSLFTRGKGGGAGCGARDCCAMRPPALDDDGWLMCDDELVKQVSKDDFDDLLSPEPKVRSPATPYLLFYVKSDTVPV